MDFPSDLHTPANVPSAPRVSHSSFAAGGHEWAPSSPGPDGQQPSLTTNVLSGPQVTGGRSCTWTGSESTGSKHWMASARNVGCSGGWQNYLRLCTLAAMDMRCTHGRAQRRTRRSAAAHESTLVKTSLRNSSMMALRSPGFAETYHRVCRFSHEAARWQRCGGRGGSGGSRRAGGKGP